MKKKSKLNKKKKKYQKDRLNSIAQMRKNPVVIIRMTQTKI